MAELYINKGVILAAGDGTRLQPITNFQPKVLLLIQGKPLIWYPLEAMAAAGIREIAIVVGHLAAEVKKALGDGQRFGVKLNYILNPDPHSGVAISVSKVREWAGGEPFILCMGDHMVEPGIVSSLLNHQPPTETLCVDFTPANQRHIAEATKVAIDSTGHIRQIGKKLSHWDALDTGVFLFTEKFLDTIDELFPEFGVKLEITDVVRFMVSHGNQFVTRDVSGCLWQDIDTAEDLEHSTT